MLNHFAKKKLGFSKKLPPSPAYQLIYHNIPQNKLITKDELIISVMNIDSKEAKLQNEKIIFINHQSVSNVIDEMVKQGFIKEITGLQLEKFIDG